MLNNFQIILIVGAALFFLIILYLFFKPLFTRKLIQNSLDSDTKFFTDEAKQRTFDLEYKPHNEFPDEQELIILNLISLDNSNFDMNQVITLLKNLDAKYVNGFFSFIEDGNEEIFRIASGINPGLIETDTNTHVLFLAMDLNTTKDPVLAFEKMLDCASNISDKLHASICNSDRAPLSKQMIEHLRSRAQQINHLKIMKNF